MSSPDLIDAHGSSEMNPLTAEGIMGSDILGTDLLGHEGVLSALTEEEELAAAVPLTLSQAWIRIGLLAFAWALMVFWVQHLTTASTMWKEPSMLFKDYLFRFLIDFGAATFCLGMFSARVVSVLMAVNLWAATAILSYFVNYQRSLSWLTIKNQSGEGAAVAMVALEDAGPYLCLLIPVSALIVYGFIRVRRRTGSHKLLALIGASIWLAVFVGMNEDHKPLHRLERFEMADGIAHSYGYAVTWAAEEYYIDLNGLTEDALHQLTLPTDRLSKKVAPVSIGDKIAVVQVESLDDAVMNFKIDGREVTPRLNAWSKQGTYLRVQAPKVNGSCDSDFSLLYGALPSHKMAPYRIPKFPFARSLANKLHEQGYHTAFYHGVSGTFFERRAAFEHMDFDRLAFREEAVETLHLSEPEWTLEDGRLFELAEAERHNTDKFFEFTITGTSHTPFLFSLGKFGRRFYEGTDERNDAYFGTIHYVDAAIGDYVDGLPNGTVVVIYGDHWSRVKKPEVGYESQMIDNFGIVPALLFRKTENGPVPLMQVDEALARRAKLRLVDVTSYLRTSLGIAPAMQGSAQLALLN